MRQGEHDALQRLLEYVQQPKADKGETLRSVQWHRWVAALHLLPHQQPYVTA